MTERLEFLVAAAAGRLDRFLAESCQLSRSRVQRLINQGRVWVNERPGKASQKLDPGDRVVAVLPPPPPTTLIPEDMPLDIVYEDDDLVVVDKPAGLLVHPAPGHPAGTLANALLAHCSLSAGTSLRPGIVHRLDKDTSGLMAVAKNEAAHDFLSRQLKERTVMKGYLALVEGHLSPRQGAIEGAIGRDPRNRKRMAVVEGGREARTEYRVLDYMDGYTLVEARPQTGRTHQIRVHFAAVGHPVFGDPVYGHKSPLLGRQFLHAHRLGLRLPSSGEFREFASGLPPELEETLERISGGRWAVESHGGAGQGKTPL